MMIKPYPVILFAPKIISAVIVLTLFVACSEPIKDDAKEVIRPAKLVTVKSASSVKTYNLPAVIEAATSRNMVFQVSGQLVELNVEAGDEVKKGDVIAKLDQRDFRNALQSAQTQYNNAKAEFDRAKRLISQDAIAQTIFDQRKSQFEVSSANLDSAKKALEDTVMYSPFTGVIAAKLAKELDTVNPTAPIVTLQTVGAAEAVTRVPSSLVAKSKQINPIENVVILDSAPNIPMTTELVAASGLADEKSQTIEVKFAFTPPESLRILPGMTGIVRLKLSFLDDEEPKIFIPLYSVLSDGVGQYVWLASGDPLVVTRRDVTIGVSVGEELVIEDGLSDGDVIVGAGASYLFEGMKIRPLKN